jgi:hypothetical protein
MGSAVDAERRIALRVANGLLPPGPPTKTWTTGGTAEACDGCSAPIEPAHVEYNFECDGRILRFHIGCAGLWQDECARRGRPWPE